MNEGRFFRFDLWLHNEMKKMGMDQRNLALGIGISETMISRYIHNKSQPGISNLAKILKCLGKHIIIEDD